MEQIIAEYIAKKMIIDIREGYLPSPELSEAVRRFPLMDFMRDLVQSGDFLNIRRLLDAPHEEIRALGFGLLNNILNLKKVRDYLEEKWKSCDMTFRDRNAIVFTLTNCEDLSPAFHKQFSEFIFENWERWLTKVAARYAGGLQRVLDYCRVRLQDKIFPDSKKWVYLCVAAASNDSLEAQNLIGGYADAPAPFVRKIACEVLRRLKGG